MPIKTLGSLGKIRVDRVTGNTHIFFGLTAKQRYCEKSRVILMLLFSVNLVFCEIALEGAQDILGNELVGGVLVPRIKFNILRVVLLVHLAGPCDKLCNQTFQLRVNLNL